MIYEACYRHRSQRGATLFVGLVMLMLITMLSMAAIRLSTINQMIVGNEQYQMEAEDAAHYEIDRLISLAGFLDESMDGPSALPFAYGQGQPQTYHATIPRPSCKRFRYITVGELINPQGYVSGGDAACIGVLGGEVTMVDPDSTTAAENSLCAAALWEVEARITIPDVGADVTVRQGVGVRSDFTAAENACL